MKTKTYYHHKLGALKKASKPKKLNLSFKKAIPVAFIIFVAISASSYFWYKTSLQPAGRGTAKTFIVSEGDSVGQIMDRLKDESLIKSSTALKIHARINGTFAKLKVGTYAISPEYSGPQIVEIISGGRVSTKLTILAGKTVEEITPRLYQEFGQDQVQETLDSITPEFHPILADQKGTRVNLEGYLLPETYTDLDASSTFESWLKRNFDLYEERISKLDLKVRLNQRGFTMQEGFTLASIIQQESSKPDEQKKIAQVFESRLTQNISLGADPTFIYAAKLKGVEPSPKIDSPYNTRINKGLPPTPIGTFELSALQAVAEPAEGDFLFFVAGDDGKIYYTRSEEEHQVSIKEHCKENCSLF